MKMATRPEEKRQVLARIANIPTEAAMKMAQACVSDPALANDAKAAVEKIDRAMKHPAQCMASTEADVDKAVDGNPRHAMDHGQPHAGRRVVHARHGRVSGRSRRSPWTARRSDGDYPRGYEVYVSNSRTKLGQPVAKGKGKNAVTEITFAPTSGRYVKIVQTGKAEGLYWSIHELRVE